MNMNYLTFSREILKRNYDILKSSYNERNQIDELLSLLKENNENYFNKLSSIIVNNTVEVYMKKCLQWEWKLKFSYNEDKDYEDLTYCENYTQGLVNYDILIDIVGTDRLGFGIYIFIKDDKITLHISAETEEDWIQLFLKEYNNYDEMMSHLTDDFIMLETLSSTLSYNNRNIEC